MDQPEAMPGVEARSGSAHPRDVVDGREDRRRLVIGERVPGDAGLAADRLDRGAVALEAVGLLAAEDVDSVPAPRAADQIGQHLRAAERVCQSIVSDVQDRCGSGLGVGDVGVIQGAADLSSGLQSPDGPVRSMTLAAIPLPCCWGPQEVLLTVTLINPADGSPLQRCGDRLVDENGHGFPVLEGVPRICPPDNYTQNFGLQWNMFQTTQLDRADAGLDLSEERFFRETGWTAEDLAGEDVLEVGSGAGRFSKTVLEHTAARLYSVDYSSAVEANQRNNGAIAPDRFQLFQASIYEMPFPDGSFDKVFCLGVLQHTPDFEASVRALVAKAKPGGEIVVDFYPIRGWWTKLNAKYLLRPFTKRMSHDRLLKLVDPTSTG